VLKSLYIQTIFEILSIGNRQKWIGVSSKTVGVSLITQEPFIVKNYFIIILMIIIILIFNREARKFRRDSFIDHNSHTVMYLASSDARKRPI
jgi:hypothetical protein